MSEEAERRIAEAKAKGASRLDLAGLGLTAIPDSLFSHSRLSILYLNNNQLTSIPDALAALPIQALNLSRNRIAAIPDSLASLSKLMVLLLGTNQIAAIPDSFAGLPKLQYLDLDNNRITAIPVPFCGLPKLQYLNLNNNRIAAIPGSLSGLCELLRLSLNDNQITTLPDSLACLPEFLYFSIKNNPLQGELGDVAKLGWSRLRQYLADLAQTGEYQWRVKLLLVGEGGVGKTNLLNRLRGEDFQINLNPTHALEIRSVSIPHPTRPDVNLEFRAWDFGGQVFYHATHQFFYSGQSIFCLVWNVREDVKGDTLRPWMDRIQALAPNSPVLLVGTWADHVTANIALAELQEKYPQVRGFHAVDNSSGTGISELKDALRDEALQLDHVGCRRPAAWIKATDAIRNHPENYVEFTRFQKLVTSNGVLGFDAFTEYLGQTGEITFFPRNPIYQPEQCDLRNWVVLKPDWLLQQVSRLITDPRVAQSGGIVDAAEQQRVWQQNPPLVQEFLLLMMDHFDLAYRTETQPVRSIVVELSPEGRPADVDRRWEQTGATSQVTIEYRFETTIPPGLPTWFIARSHRFTTPKLHWRRGAFMTDAAERHHALLQADLDGRNVVLTARGPLPQNFFALLRDCFEGTLRRFPGLLTRVNRMVPCPKAGCKGAIKVDDLEAYYKENDEYIRCHGCRSRYSIAELLFGIHPAGTEVAVQKLGDEVRDFANRSENQIQELRTYLEREFTNAFFREQSLSESHCPSVFTLETERLPDLMKSWMEARWDDITDRGEPARLTLYCEQPGGMHPVNSYLIEAPARRLGELAPHVQKLANLFKVVGPFIGLLHPAAKAGIDAMKALAEIGAESWPDTGTDALAGLEESRHPGAADRNTLFALRRLLEEVAPWQPNCCGGLYKVLTKQFHYLWLCEEHARPHVSRLT